MNSPPSFFLRSLLQHKSESSSSLNHETHQSKHDDSNKVSTTTIHQSHSNSSSHETGFEKGKVIIEKAIVTVSHTTKSIKIFFSIFIYFLTL